MKPDFINQVWLGFAVALVVSGCASAPPEKHSGFLSDYSNMTKQETMAGGKAMVYVSPSLTPAHYHAVILEPVKYYPEPQPTEQVSMETLNEILHYADQALREKLGQKVRLVDSPGPGVVRWKGAFTAVGDEKRAMKIYQFVPIALVITGVKAAAQGGLPVDATIAFENEAVDSVTNESLYRVVRGGTGERIKKSDEGNYNLTVDSLKPLIDKWATNAAENITKYIQAK
jgi:uncharacterized protein DUF3313